MAPRKCSVTSSKEPAASDHEIGYGDGILSMMRHHNIPITREHYLNIAYMGEPPEELSAEEEANLPPMLRRLSLATPKLRGETRLRICRASKKGRIEGRKRRLCGA
jgi:hypothetical protein